MIHLLESKRIVYQSGVFEGEISDHMKKKRNEREEEDMKNVKRHAWIFTTEVQKVVNPVILDDRKYFQNQGLAENISKT